MHAHTHMQFTHMRMYIHTQYTQVIVPFRQLLVLQKELSYVTYMYVCIYLFRLVSWKENLRQRPRVKRMHREISGSKS